MKKAFCLILALVLLLLAGCGTKDVSGLGSLTMNETNNSPSTGGIGTLGQPSTDPNAPTETAPPTTPDAPAPAPTETPAPTAPPEPEGMQTEEYACPYFTVTKPVGWEVQYQVMPLDDGTTNFAAYIFDPADPNNMIFYIKMLQPFFSTLEMKNRFLSYGPGNIFEWSPVLDPLNVEGVLREWASAYTMMEIDGTLQFIPFRNYRLEEVLQNYDAGTVNNSVVSGVLAEVSIPNADTSYGIFLENMLTPMQIPNTSVIFYMGENNLGFVADPAVFNNYCNVLNDCKNSFDFSGSRGQYGLAEEESAKPFGELGDYSIGS